MIDMTRGGSRTAATSKMERFAAVLDPPLVTASKSFSKELLLYHTD